MQVSSWKAWTRITSAQWLGPWITSDPTRNVHVHRSSCYRNETKRHSVPSYQEGSLCFESLKDRQMNRLSWQIYRYLVLFYTYSLHSRINGSIELRHNTSNIVFSQGSSLGNLIKAGNVLSAPSSCLPISSMLSNLEIAKAPPHSTPGTTPLRHLPISTASTALMMLVVDGRASHWMWQRHLLPPSWNWDLVSAWVGIVSGLGWTNGRSSQTRFAYCFYIIPSENPIYRPF